MMALKVLLDEVKSNDSIKAKVVVFLFRLSCLFMCGSVIKFLFFPFVLLNKIINEFLLCVEIPHQTKIGEGLLIYHPHCIVINPSTVIGKNCIIRQGVTIGNVMRRNGLVSGCPIIGDNVEFGAHSIVIGDITIGDNVIIGAGAVVTKSIPDNTVVVGFGFREI